ncbi:NNP family nitrate/nitrite transporter-like MFS transporter [Promicromonospora sp. AC04]|uniref:MFS transporter n=1 Tax=Promicromonospora sp. AC04 TaxID=2135723 RepID=UPI000D36CBBF|nr:MFS transporter [Promicromonospora sp. AC04]PUB24027.1 NNP family nitrate/nitrite transporter-like MFS transporter [Promicromonospora sp. AC04]
MSTPTTHDDQTPTTSEPAGSTTTGTAPEAAATTSFVQRHTGRWIEHWDPEDKTLWEDGGRRTARRNLVLSIFAEFLGFGAWALWSIVVPQLPAAGFDLTVDQMFWLISVPSLVGATLRIPYTFAVPVFGGRNWTIASALLLLLPTGALILVVGDPTTPFPVLLVAAALAGLGGGNFASSMANISFFFPEKEKGAALGWNAAGGNIGTAAVQLAVPLVIVTGAGVALDRAGLIFIPFILLAAFLAWRWMDNLTEAKADPRSFGVAVHDKHTWIISFIYIGTFGSFIGYAGAFPTLLKGEFPEVALPLAFMGALVGSIARPVGGILADRVGGVAVTLGSFAVMALGAMGAIYALGTGSFAMFFGSFLVLFVATGMGNGSVYRMIPAVFRASGGTVKAAAGCIGIAGAIGAFGGFLIPRGFALSTTLAGSLVPALWLFIGVYAVMAFVTWFVYGRGAMAEARV